MDGEAIREVAKLEAAKIITAEVEGRKFLAKDRFSEVEPRKFPTIHTKSLTSFIEAIKGCDYKDPSFEGMKPLVVVSQHDSAYFRMEGNGRSTVVADLSLDLDTFRFDEYISVEDFRVNLITKFKGGGDMDALMKYTSKITDKTEVVLDDNGVTMKLTLTESSSGAVVDQKSFSSQVSLKPVRTFVEVDQPESVFLLRIKKQSVALFDCSNGEWKNEAAEKIRDIIGHELECMGDGFPFPRVV